MGKSEEEKTDDDYKDGAVTKNALQVITIIGEIEGHDNILMNRLRLNIKRTQRLNPKGSVKP